LWNEDAMVDYIYGFFSSKHFHAIPQTHRGNGTTSAVELLIDCLGLRHHICNYSSRRSNTNSNDRPVIFVSTCEHHSNLLLWRELGDVDVETVGLDPTTGSIDLDHLRSLLEHYKYRTVKIGAFSAASNVTGVIADDIHVTALLHQHGALSFWDYATGASYLDMSMNPIHPQYAPHLTAKDASVFSGHKLLGGVGTPGVLIIKNHLINQQRAPTRCGGGTVLYVTTDDQRYLSNPIERFEGGTPNIVGIWRLGLVFINKLRLKAQRQALMASKKTNVQSVLETDVERALRIQRELSSIPNLVLLDAGYSDSSESTYKKLPIYSFLIKWGTRFLHYNFVCALLNDVFGIQSRGGCSCAGPFGLHLLGLYDEEIINSIKESLLRGNELIRPGFTRLSLPVFGTTQAMEDYVIRSIAWVAQHG